MAKFNSCLDLSSNKHNIHCTILIISLQFFSSYVAVSLYSGYQPHCTSLDRTLSSFTQDEHGLTSKQVDGKSSSLSPLILAYMSVCYNMPDEKVFVYLVHTPSTNTKNIHGHTHV